MSFYSIKISEIKSRKKGKKLCKNFFKAFERKSRKKKSIKSFQVQDIDQAYILVENILT